MFHVKSLVMLIALTALIASCADPPATAPARSTVAGRVFVGESSGTIPKVKVRIAGQEITTVRNGRFEFINLEPGEYSLTAEKAGYEPYVATIAAYGHIQHDIRLTRILSN